MPHGQPDFGMYKQKETTFGLDDMGELAVRLGSMVSHDRRGDVIWYDEFDGGITKWFITGTGIGWGADDVSEYARTGFLTMKMTTGNAIGNICDALHRVAYPALSRIGFEISFLGTTGLARIDFHLSLNAVGIGWSALIRYTVAAQTLSYRDIGGIFRVFAAGLDLTTYATLFHVLKFVGDFVSKKYVRCIFDEAEYDLSAFDMLPYIPAVPPYIGASIAITSAVIGNQSTYIDDVIITQNEP